MSSLDQAQTLLRVELTFPTLNRRGPIRVELEDDGHQRVTGAVRCGTTRLARIVAREALYAFVWRAP